MRLPSALPVFLGNSRARAPVAMIMCLAVSSVVLPSASTTSLLAETNLPEPMCTSILFFFIRPVTPLLSCPATPRERWTMAPRSALTLSRGQAIVLGVLHLVKHFGRTQQRLGRDAAPVEADAAQILALDDRGLQAELRRADGSDIAAGAGTEDDEIVWVGHAGNSFRNRSGADALHRRSRRK